MKFKNYLSRFLMLSSRMIQLNWDPFWRCTAFKYCLQKPWGHRCCSGSNDAIKPTQNRRNSGKKWWVLHSTGAIPPTCVLCAIIADLICCTTIFVVSSFVLKKRIAYCVSKHTKDVPDEEEVSLHLMLLSINIRSNVPT